jgi:hypothetical protein
VKNQDENKKAGEQENKEPGKQNNSKNTSQKKIEANRRNSVRSTGPKTEEGKRWSRINAFKHGLFASALHVTDLEKPEFDHLRQALYIQLLPDSIVLQIGFERVVVASWRLKLLLRIEQKAFKACLEVEENEQPQSDVSMESGLPTRWYGTSTKDFRQAMAYLSSLLQEVEANGLLHAGDSLIDWEPINVAAIQMAKGLIGHATNFNMPLPGSLTGEVENNHTSDSGFNSQMVVKIIKLKQQHVADFLRIRGSEGDGRDQDQSAIRLDLVSRYVNTATRELERAINWYVELKTQGL